MQTIGIKDLQINPENRLPRFARNDNPLFS